MDEKTEGPPLLAMGFMCGTSLDGIDGSIISVENGRIVLLAFEQAPFLPPMRRWLKQWMDGGEIKDPSRFMPDLADLLAQTEETLGRSLLSRSGHHRGDLSVVGTHGVTVRHAPGPHMVEGFPEGTMIRGVSYQFSNPFPLARAFCTPVISQFRGADLAAGGQGAPLAPILHRALFTGDRPLGFLNLGGIANLTYLPEQGSGKAMIAFDTGPGNMLLDLAMVSLSEGRQSFDANGRSAEKGQVIVPLLDTLLSDPYFSLPPPKSTGRDEWGGKKLQFVLDRCQQMGIAPARHLEDVMATLTELTSAGVAMGVAALPELPDRIVVGGGGVNNAFLMKRIAARTGLGVFSSGDFGYPAQAIESIAFAYMALLTISGRNGSVPEATGGREGTLLGQITPPPGRLLSPFLKSLEDRADIHLPFPDRSRV